MFKLPGLKVCVPHSQELSSLWILCLPMSNPPPQTTRMSAYTASYEGGQGLMKTIPLESSCSPDSMCSRSPQEPFGLDSASPKCLPLSPCPPNPYFHCQKFKYSLEGPWNYFAYERTQTETHVAGVSRPFECTLVLPQ